MRNIFYGILLLITAVLSAGNDYLNPGGRAAGLGSASVMHRDVYSVFSNPAGLMGLQHIGIGLAAQNRFLITDLSLYNLAIGIPTKSGNFGVGMYYFGGEFLNEKEGRLAYARNFFEGLSAGIALNFHQLSTAEFGSATLFSFDLGFNYAITDKINAAAHVYNPLRQKMSENDIDYWPTIIRFGLSYKPSDKAGVYAEFEKNIDFKTIIKTGIEYKPIEKFALRAGYSSNPNLFSAGIGLVLKTIDVDIAGSFHPDLGYSPYLSFTYKGKAKNTEVVSPTAH